MRSLVVASAALLTLTRTEAHSGTPPHIGRIHWLSEPTSADIMAVMPKRAIRKGVQGDASMTCLVVADGSVTGCKIDFEDPPGQRFGSAALKLAHIYKLDMTLLQPHQLSVLIFFPPHSVP